MNGVIVTGMKMPKCCSGCPILDSEYGECQHTYVATTWNEEDGRPPNCSLKSVEGLIEKINEMDFDFGDYYDHTEKIQDMVIKVIKEYCEVTEWKEYR